jgi:GDPmannose 4,6-dehydratase
MEKVAFITGINGQDGSYLSELLLEKGYYVYGILRRMSLMNTERIDHITQQKNERFKYIYGDITDTYSLYNVFEMILKEHQNPRIEVYHLAAQSHVRVSFDMPEYTATVDALGTLKLLEVCRTIRDRCKLTQEQLRIYIACTSELFGEVLEIPQTEQTPFNPRSPYAIAKQFAFYISKNYREAYHMFVANGILFNHESPRRGFNFVTRKITLGLGKILRGEMDVLEMGNIDSIRDWGHAKDYVEAMYLMLQQEKPDDFVIATNETHSVREFIEKTFAMRDLKIQWQGERGSLEEVGVDQNGVVRIRIHPRYFRPTEVAYLQGDATKARTELHWEPKISFDELVQEMVQYDTSV